MQWLLLMQAYVALIGILPFIIGGVIWVMMRKKYNIIITLAMPVLVLSLISFMQSFGSIFK